MEETSEVKNEKDESLCPLCRERPHEGWIPTWNLLGGAPDPNAPPVCSVCYWQYVEFTGQDGGYDRGTGSWRVESY
jgi:hypothetical protein